MNISQRFIGQDPVGFKGGDTNLCGYLWETPIDWSDDAGYGELDVGGVVTGSGGAGFGSFGVAGSPGGGAVWFLGPDGPSAGRYAGIEASLAVRVGASYPSGSNLRAIATLRVDLTHEKIGGSSKMQNYPDDSEGPSTL